MNFRLSGPANHDLLEIWCYTNREWGQIHADLYTDGLVTRCAWLATNRRVWQKRNELADQLRSYHHERHVILFRQVDGGIEIIRVLHERMDILERADDT